MLACSTVTVVNSCQWHSYMHRDYHVLGGGANCMPQSLEPWSYKHSIKKWLTCSLIWLGYWGNCRCGHSYNKNHVCVFLLVTGMTSIVACVKKYVDVPGAVLQCRIWVKTHSHTGYFRFCSSCGKYHFRKYVDEKCAYILLSRWIRGLGVPVIIVLAQDCFLPLFVAL